MRHDEQNRIKSTQKEQNEREKNDRTTGIKSNIEQLVNAVKEGFKTQNDFLANTIKGNNQIQQEPTNQVQGIPLNQI